MPGSPPPAASARVTREDQSTWAVAAGILRAAPRRTRLFVGVTMTALTLLTVFVVWELTRSDRPTAQIQIWSLILGNAGLVLWSLAAVLHGASQNERTHRPGRADASDLIGRIWARCGWWWWRVRRRDGKNPQDLHENLLVLPVLAVAAACLLAVATGFLLPAVVESPTLLGPVFTYAIFVMMAVGTVSDTTRFLYRHARQQAEAAAFARNQATEAQLAALQAQLNPHFLFNALNTVASLVRTDPRKAEATVENLAQVLRRTLDRSRHLSSTIDDEIDYLAAYLSVEQERYGDRLRVEWTIEPDTRTLRIPPMTLQPLVENSLKHGIGGRLEGGRLEIRTTVSDGALHLRVADDGVGFAPRFREGTGLRNLRERLETLYGANARILIERHGHTGAAVTVVLPAIGQASLAS